VPREGAFHDHLMSNMTREEMKMYLDIARAEAKASAAEVARSQADLRADFKAGMAAVSVDVANLKIDFSNLKSDFSNLRNDFSDLKSDLHATVAAQTNGSPLWVSASLQLSRRSALLSNFTGSCDAGLRCLRRGYTSNLFPSVPAAGAIRSRPT
jgi:uncharacterized phage infection (PIP) family protein YhgE